MEGHVVDDVDVDNCGKVDDDNDVEAVDGGCVVEDVADAVQEEEEEKRETERQEDESQEDRDAEEQEDEVVDEMGCEDDREGDGEEGDDESEVTNAGEEERLGVHDDLRVSKSLFSF